MRIGIGVGAGTGDDGTIDALLGQFQRAESDGFQFAAMANIFRYDHCLLGLPLRASFMPSCSGSKRRVCPRNITLITSSATKVTAT